MQLIALSFVFVAVAVVCQSLSPTENEKHASVFQASQAALNQWPYRNDSIVQLGLDFFPHTLGGHKATCCVVNYGDYVVGAGEQEFPFY